MTSPAPIRGSAVSAVMALVREAMLAWFNPAADAHAPFGGRVDTVELWPGTNTVLPAIPSGQGRCRSVAAMQVVDVFGSSAADFPDAVGRDACGTGTAVTLLASVWRCGFTLKTGGKRVSADTLERWTKIAVDDEWRLRRAICAALNRASAVTGDRAVEGGPVALATSLGGWTNDEVEGGWFGGSREFRFLIADGWV